MKRQLKSKLLFLLLQIIKDTNMKQQNGGQKKNKQTMEGSSDYKRMNLFIR